MFCCSGERPRKGGLRCTKGLNTTIYKLINKRKPDHNPMSAGARKGAKGSRKRGVRAVSPAPGDLDHFLLPCRSHPRQHRAAKTGSSKVAVPHLSGSRGGAVNAGLEQVTLLFLFGCCLSIDVSIFRSTYLPINQSIKTIQNIHNYIYIYTYYMLDFRGLPK